MRLNTSHHSIKYLAPYVFKVAISDNRILHYDHQKVMFHYKKPGSRRLRKMTVDTMEFMRRFLQHVLPTGFMKIRYYGFMGPGSSIPLERIRSLIQSSLGFKEQRPIETPKSSPKPICPECGAGLKLRCHIYYIRPLPLPDFGFG